MSGDPTPALKAAIRTMDGSSETGQRYQRHAALGTAAMLFARLRSDDRLFWFLGPASYEGHESELPMAIRWRLAHGFAPNCMGDG